MTLLKDIVDEVRKDLSAGIGNDESRFDDEYLENKIHAARAVIIANYISNNRFFNDSWIQTVDINFVDRDKECEAVYFECPSPITITAHEDGFMYVGHINGVKPFLRARKNGLTTLTMHSIFQGDKDLYWDWKQLEQNKASLIVYNNTRLEYIQVRGIFNHPTEVPGFRVDSDTYPVDAFVRKELVEMVTLDIMRKMRIAPDYISDSQDKVNPQLPGK